MPVSPPDFLRLSTQLYVANCDEITRRCVVSRAYYAALHAVRETFEKREQEAGEDGESTHARVIGRAVAYASSLQPGRTSAAQIAKLMPRLRRTRNRADYDLEEHFEARECDDVTVRAAKVLELCADVVRLREASAPQIAAGGG